MWTLRCLLQGRRFHPHSKRKWVCPTRPPLTLTLAGGFADSTESCFGADLPLNFVSGLFLVGVFLVRSSSARHRSRSEGTGGRLELVELTEAAQSMSTAEGLPARSLGASAEGEYYGDGDQGCNYKIAQETGDRLQDTVRYLPTTPSIGPAVVRSLEALWVVSLVMTEASCAT